MFPSENRVFQVESEGKPRDFDAVDWGHCISDDGKTHDSRAALLSFLSQSNVI
jgi:hypothetical protein